MTFSGFVSVHVTGLPAGHGLPDTELEAQLRRALDNPGACGLPALADAPSLDSLEPPAEVPAVDESQGHAAASTEESRAVAAAAPDAVAVALAGSGEGIETESETEAEKDLAAVAELLDKTGSLEGTLFSDFCYSCSVSRTRLGECRGFCFLEFETLQAAEIAIGILNRGVQIGGSVIAAQVATDHGAEVFAQRDKHRKDAKKAAKILKAEAAFDSTTEGQLGHKYRGYTAQPGEVGGAPLKKSGLRPKTALLQKQRAILIEKKRENHLADLAARAATLCLEDAERLLELQNREEQLALTNQPA